MNTPGSHNDGGRPRRAARLPLVAAMLVAVVAAGAMRHVAMAYQYDRASRVAGGTTPGRGAAALGSMNSFALALLLGGLRGPLAMILWATSEAQKTDRNLEDFDTKVEWIRLLQPEFDTVHMFQIWNKAYNISVQMASLPNRYATILDALGYAADVDRERPGNVNIMNAIAQVYSNKLGTVHEEKNFYRRWVREQSMAPADWKPDPAQGMTNRRLQGGRMEPKLDPAGRILPELLAPRPGLRRPPGLPEGSDWNTGAELQYLEKYQPYPHGLSPFALAYNYAKRAQVLMTVGKQVPLQLSDAVIDSRPGLEMKLWAEDEWERGRRFELQAFGGQAPPERLDMELPAAALPPGQAPADPAAVAPALYSYDMASRLSGEAVLEFQRHVRNPNYVGRNFTYDLHIDEMTALSHFATADRDYLKAVVAEDPAAREALLTAAAAGYQNAIGAYQLVLLKYYVDDSVVAKTYGEGVDRQSVGKLTRQQQDEIMSRVRAELQQHENAAQHQAHGEDFAEYATYITRATIRLGQMLRR